MNDKRSADEKDVWRHEPNQSNDQLDEDVIGCVRSLVCSASAPDNAFGSHSVVSIVGDPISRSPPEPPTASASTRLPVRDTTSKKKGRRLKQQQKNTPAGESVVIAKTFCSATQLIAMRDRQRQFAFAQICWNLRSTANLIHWCDKDSMSARFALNPCWTVGQLNAFVKDSTRQNWLLLTVQCHTLTDTDNTQQESEACSLECGPGSENGTSPITTNQSEEDPSPRSPSTPQEASHRDGHRSVPGPETSPQMESTTTSLLEVEQARLRLLAPAEITLARFSLRHGVRQICHWVFADYRNPSAATVDSTPNACARSAYGQAYSQITSCVNKVRSSCSANMPVLYVHSEKWNETVAVIENHLKPAACVAPHKGLLPNSIYCVEDLFAMLSAPTLHQIRLCDPAEAPLSLEDEWAEIGHRSTQFDGGVPPLAVQQCSDQSMQLQCVDHDVSLSRCSLTQTRLTLFQLRSAMQMVTKSLTLARSDEILSTPVTYSNPLADSNPVSVPMSVDEQSPHHVSESMATSPQSRGCQLGVPRTQTQMMEVPAWNVPLTLLTDAPPSSQSQPNGPAACAQVKGLGDGVLSVPERSVTFGAVFDDEGADQLAALQHSNIDTDESIELCNDEGLRSVGSSDCDFPLWTPAKESQVTQLILQPLAQPLPQHLAYVQQFIANLKDDDVLCSSVADEYAGWADELPSVAVPRPQTNPPLRPEMDD